MQVKVQAEVMSIVDEVAIKTTSTANEVMTKTLDSWGGRLKFIGQDMKTLTVLFPHPASPPSLAI